VKRVLIASAEASKMT